MQFNKIGNIYQFADEIKNIDLANGLHIGDTYNISDEKVESKEAEVTKPVDDELAILRKRYPQYSHNQLRMAKKMLFGNCKIMSISEKYR